jgi:membrane AbrB-like protein
VQFKNLFKGQYADWLTDPRQYLMLVAAVLGGAVGWWLNIPAPWLTGAMAATIVLAASGWGAALAPPLRDLAMLSSGLTLGSAVTSETLRTFITIPLSLLGLAVTSLVVMVVTSSVLVRYSGWQRRDAVLAATPGALSSVLAIAVEEGADVPRIAIVQLFRLVMLVAVLPSLMVFVGLSTTPSVAVQPYMKVASIVLIIGFGLVGAFGLKALKMSAPFVLGPMLVVGALRGMDFFPGQYPFELSTAGFVLIGALIGGRFQGMRMREIVAIAPAAMVSFLVATGLGLIGAAIVSNLIGFPLSSALIAFAPGGLEAMTALAFALRIDPVIVGVHHIARFTLIGIGLPLVMKLRPSLIRGTHL